MSYVKVGEGNKENSPPNFLIKMEKQKKRKNSALDVI